jgi:class 3 adenylate cyclase
MLRGAGIVSAQDPRVIWEDSSRPDTERVDALGQMVWGEYLFTQPDSALHYLGLQAEMARRIGSAALEGDALKNMGIAWKLLGDEQQAMGRWEEALATYQAEGDERGMARVLVNMGILTMERGRYLEALGALMDALRLADRTGDARLMATVRANLGAIHMDLRDAPQARQYLEEALATFNTVGDSVSIVPLLGNLSDLYQQAGDTAGAYAILDRCRRLATQAGNDHWVALARTNLGVMRYRSDPRGALAEYEQALRYFDETGDPVGRASVRTHMARAWMQLGDRGMAEVLAREGHTIAVEAAAHRQAYDAAEVLYSILRDKGDAKGALAMHERFVALRDSVVGEDKARELVRQQFAYAYEKKEALRAAEQEKKDALAAAELRRKDLQRNAFVAGFGLMVLLALTFFTQRNRIGREKERSEELLLNILPARVADELKERGEAEPRLIDQATVLFTDFKGFTALSERLSPKELVKDLNECFSAFDRICERHGIEKIKTIGDAYMAAGGLPTPNTTHATDVIKAALEMRDFIAVGKVRKMALGLPYFEVRIGVHSGPVVAGIVGLKKFQYDIWGDTVNTASRMESSGEVGQVNISEATYRLVKEVNGEGQMANGGTETEPQAHSPFTSRYRSGSHSPAFTFTPRGKVQAKGKGEMAMWYAEWA